MKCGPFTDQVDCNRPKRRLAMLRCSESHLNKARFHVLFLHFSSLEGEHHPSFTKPVIIFILHIHKWPQTIYLNGVEGDNGCSQALTSSQIGWIGSGVLVDSSYGTYGEYSVFYFKAFLEDFDFFCTIVVIHVWVERCTTPSLDCTSIT